MNSDLDKEVLITVAQQYMISAKTTISADTYQEAILKCKQIVDKLAEEFNER